MLKRWFQFYGERCAGATVSLSSSAFATDLIVQRLLGATQVTLDWETLLSMLTVVLMGSAFRCSDELRDMQTDIQYFPTRPLAAGRISPNEVKVLAVVMVLLSILINLAWLTALVPVLAATFFLVLTHNWYFLPSHIPHNRFLAVTVNLPFLYSLFLYPALAMAAHHGYPNNSWIPYAVAGWMLIPIHTFEFARKLVPEGYERPGYQTYSALLGARPAAWFAFSTAVLHYGLAAVWAPARQLYGIWFWILGGVLLLYFGVTVFFNWAQGRRFKNAALQKFFEEGPGGPAGFYGVCSRVFSVLSAFRLFG